MALSPHLSSRLQFARTVREQFLLESEKGMAEIGDAVQERLTTLMDEPGSARENQTRRDVWMLYRRSRSTWLETTKKVWRECLEPVAVMKSPQLDVVGFELVSADVAENKILASRMVMAVMDKVSAAFDDLRVRMRLLEATEDLSDTDVLRPDVLVSKLVEQWVASGMTGDVIYVDAGLHNMA